MMASGHGALRPLRRSPGMWQQQTIDTGPGRSLHLAQKGEGADLVLIHGALTTSHDWLASPVAERLAETARVTVIDRPGHGHSRRPRFEGTPRDQAAQIAAGLDQIGIARCVVVGHSFGAIVALALAEGHAALVDNLVLIAPIAFPEVRSLEHSMLTPRALPLVGPFFARLAEMSGIDRKAAPLLHKMMFHPSEIPAHWQRSYPFDLTLSAEALVFEGEDSAAMLPGSAAGTIAMAAIRTPVRIVTGTQDKVVEDERQAKLLGRLLADGRITEIEGGGHMLHHSHPEAVLSVIREAIPARA